MTSADPYVVVIEDNFMLSLLDLSGFQTVLWGELCHNSLCTWPGLIVCCPNRNSIVSNLDLGAEHSVSSGDVAVYVF